MTAPYFGDVTEGTELPPLTKHVDMVQMMMYGAATWDFMRIHYDADYARQLGFEQAFVDGQMLGAFLAQHVVDWVGDPSALRRLGVRYRNFVFPGDTVTCSGVVQRTFVEADEAFAECEVVAKNQRGEIVAGPSKALVVLPRKAAN
ncbi:MAG: MaoC/PaaZ C-terminal domain-containing protein [Candidatus Tectomicrobia bacterium]|nr:MaoC/PaaZ C-terminal domain-containing protein [Candidatus Tectomicrobia bacterium]